MKIPTIQSVMVNFNKVIEEFASKRVGQKMKLSLK